MGGWRALHLGQGNQGQGIRCHHIRLNTALRSGLALCALAAPGQIMAQQIVDTRMENDTAASRLRPEYDQPGVPAGSFLLYPTLTADAAYNDNIYARSDIKDGDASITVRPQITARSQWAHNELNVIARGEIDRYAKHVSENVETGAIGFDGRFDLDRQLNLSADAMVSSNIEPRGSSGDTLFGAKPVAYGQVTANLKLDKAFDRTRVTLSGHLDRYRYIARDLNTVPIDLSYRDFNYLEGKARLAQAVSPGVAAYLEVELDNNVYAHPTPGTGQRDSTQYAALAGFTFGINRLLQGEGALGYFHRDFRDNAYAHVAGLDYHLALAWSPTRLTTVNFAADKAFQRAPMLGVAGFEQQDFSVTVTHELLRNLLLRPGMSYSLANYVGSPFHDRFAQAQVGATWLLGQRWRVDANATHRLGRYSDPTLSARNFNQNRVSASLTYRF